MIDTQRITAATVKLAPGVGAGTWQREVALSEGWQFARLAPGAANTPAELDAQGAKFAPAIVPGTVAMADPPGASTLKLDAWDHWYRCAFTDPGDASLQRWLLCLDGLASIAEVFFNGQLLVTSGNMFKAQVCDVSGFLADHNTLDVRFPALLPLLRRRWPPGRWPTRLVTERNLRFFRTTLLGYMPGFCPEIRPVGPYRGVRLVGQRTLALEDVRIAAGFDGVHGLLEVKLTGRLLDGARISSAELVAGGSRAQLSIESNADSFALHGRLIVENVEPWWPHTYGAPRLYDVSVDVDANGARETVRLRAVGFRSLSLHERGFGLRVNGVPVYCRGACWTPLDLAALNATPDAYRAALVQAAEAGVNMFRLTGNMIYESDTFYALCDELGILVFQDFMFANMDYPVEDAEFLASCRGEVRQFLQRVTGRACIAVLCGNSEVAQQAAMMGTEKENWSNALFDDVIPQICAELRPDVPYVPSSPNGGDLPFRSGPGPTHYYGVGAYLRSIDDARLRPLRFVSECLAFSHPPEDEVLRDWFGDDAVSVQDPRYRERVPRDRGAGWDFADVTDHYVETLFGRSARDVRYADQERYLALSRVAPSEVMARVQGFWRQPNSGCGGALIWFWRDLQEGPGFGLVDSRGVPKAPYYYLKRAWAPIAVWFVDEGTDGLVLHAVNDGPDALAGVVRLALYRKGGSVLERAERAVTISARGALQFGVEDLLGRFVDISYAYRFGPPSHTLVAARLVLGADGRGTLASARAFHLPLGLAHDPEPDVGLSAVARARGDGVYEITVSAERFAQSVSIEAVGYLANDNYFHLAPHEAHVIVLTPRRSGVALRGKVRALNAVKTAVIRIEAGASRVELR